MSDTQAKRAAEAERETSKVNEELVEARREGDTALAELRAVNLETIIHGALRKAR